MLADFRWDGSRYRTASGSSDSRVESLSMHWILDQDLDGGAGQLLILKEVIVAQVILQETG